MPTDTDTPALTSLRRIAAAVDGLGQKASRHCARAVLDAVAQARCLIPEIDQPPARKFYVTLRGGPLDGTRHLVRRSREEDRLNTPLTFPMDHGAGLMFDVHYDAPDADDISYFRAP